MEHVSWINDFLVFLAIAGIAVPLLHRFGVSQVLAFLVLGIAVGPYGFGRLAHDFPWLAHLTLNDRERVAPFAELGVMALLFLIGLELSWSRLAVLRKYVVGVGGLQFAGSAVAIGIGAALFGSSPLAAAVIGLALAMSSTAIVMQLIEQQGRTATHSGRIALSVLLFQDLMVAPVLFVAGFSGAGALAELGWTVAVGIALVAAVAVAGHFVLGSLFRLVAQTGSRELIMAISLLVLVGFSILTERVGLSVALGAFLAGLLLSETEYRHQIEIDLSPFKGLLIGLFFISVGMSVDLAFVLKWLPQIFALALVLIIAKAAVLFGATRVFAIAAPEAAELALLLSQAGEFGFVALAVAVAGKTLDPATAQFLTATIALTMVVTPLLARAGRLAANRLERRAATASRQLPERDGLTDHVIIGGFGRVGRMVARLLTEENIPWIALDMNAQLVASERKAGKTVYFGDASRVELLERAGAAHARAFIVTLDEADAAERMVAAVRECRSDAVVLARATDRKSAEALIRLGAVEVVPETFEASLQLGGRTLEVLGASEDAVAHRLASIRDEFETAIRREG